jgi:hypothetical protein
LPAEINLEILQYLGCSDLVSLPQSVFSNQNNKNKKSRILVCFVFVTRASSAWDSCVFLFLYGALSRPFRVVAAQSRALSATSAARRLCGIAGTACVCVGC